MSGDSLILYVTLGSSDLKRSGVFYDLALAPLGYRRSPEASATFIGWGPSYDNGVSLWVTAPFDGQAPTAGNGTMIAFRAQDESQVRAFHKAALAHGGSDEGAPGTRPTYEPSFYVAYVRDPDGNKLACAFHRHRPNQQILTPRKARSACPGPIDREARSGPHLPDRGPRTAAARLPGSHLCYLNAADSADIALPAPLLPQHLGDLHRVQRSALAQVVAGHEEHYLASLAEAGAAR